MLQTIREITTRLAIINLPKPSIVLLRSFSTTAALARVFNPRYPNDDARKADYKRQNEYHKARCRNDPVYHAQLLARKRAYYDSKRKNDAYVRLYVQLSRWVMTHEWVRADLDWKTHVPVWHESSVEHYCHGCDWTRMKGARLWWRKRDAAAAGVVVGNAGERRDSDKSDEYLCHKCYVSSRTRSEALPEGYEDVKGFKDVVARKRQLDELAASVPSDTSHR